MSILKKIVLYFILAIVILFLLSEMDDNPPDLNSRRLNKAMHSMPAMRDTIIQYQGKEGRRLENLNFLVPKYTSEIKNDPWGNPYTMLAQDGVLISTGPDEKMNLEDVADPVNRDNLIVSYLPPLAISDAQQTVDLNKNGLLDNDDVITIYFCKTPYTPVAASAGGADFTFWGRPEISQTGEIRFTVFNPDSRDKGRDVNGLSNADIGKLTVLEPGPGAGPGTLNGKYDFVNLKVARDKNVPFEAELFVRFADSAVSWPWSSLKYADRRHNLAVQAETCIKIKKPL
ncbi:MAG: hypothetical protein PHW04_16440 [Candidatus Wallbacteria bacterium]|nr:hypothetical protein [Candidatus Wallbacteria bacterium]